MYFSELRFVRGAARSEDSAPALRAGDWVQVRSREEILATLDEHGRLDGMPFMPEMLELCGKTVPVFRRAHKTCDTIYQKGSQKLDRMVHLAESRCNGSAHGGCEASCAIYWSEAWLKPVSAPEEGARPREVVTEPPLRRGAGGCTMEQLMAATQKGHDPEKGPCYVCQATNYLDATQPMSPFDPRHYFEDWHSGNVSVGTLVRGFTYRLGNFVIRRAERVGRKVGIGDAFANFLVACYDLVQKVVPNGVPFPRRYGLVPAGQPTPNVPVGDIRPGSRVRVKPFLEIRKTLDSNNRNRGLYFDAEHVPYCGKEFTVRSLVNRIIDEHTGYMIHFKSPSIILEGSWCQGTFSDGRMFCPRAIYHYWRAAWLTPLEGESNRPQA